MKRKKITAIILSLCITLSLMVTSAFGAESDSKSFEQAIINVKSIVSISDDYKDFSHSSREIKNGNDVVTVWNLNWEIDQYKGGYISAQIDSYGNLCNYDKYTSDYDSSGLAKINKDSAKTKAQEFLKKAMPEYADNMKIVEDRNNNVYGDDYYFTYQQYVNNIPVSFVRVQVGVNKYTGEVDSYSGLQPGTKKLEYPSIDGIIDVDSAKNSYIQNVQSNLSYYSSYDYKLKKNNTFAAYSIMDNSNKAIDAKNGQTVNIYDEDYRFYSDKYSMGNSEASSDTMDSATLSEAEKEEVSNISGLITKERAQQILNENLEQFAKMEPGAVILDKNSTNNNYIWELNYEDGYAEINAETEEIIGFYIYGRDTKNQTQPITAEVAKSKAETLVTKLAGSKFNQTRLLNDYIDSNESFYQFDFVRQVNKIDYKSNILSVMIDKNTGDITEYNSTWDNNINAPDVSLALSKSDAFDKFNDSENFGLYYELIDNNTVGLVYDFEMGDNNYYLDAISGNKIDYRGNPYTKNEIPEYKDIQGHWCEKTVNELLENGYYIAGENFNPNSSITQLNFLKYMFSKEWNDYTEDELYDMLIERGIVKKEERNASGVVRNKDAAKFIVRYLGYEKLAQNPKIFNNQFKDSIDDEYLGYASICYGLNIIKGDSKGNFNENSSVTNAKAATYIYNLVSENKTFL